MDSDYDDIRFICTKIGYCKIDPFDHEDYIL